MEHRCPHAVRIAVSAALAIILILVVKYTVGLTWMTNDDVSVINTLSGAGGADPSYTHPYSVNVILTAPVSLLYRLIPALNWWLIYTLAAVCLGLTLIHYCIFTGFECGGHKILTAVAAVAALDLGFFFYNIERLSFTVAPAILGAGAVALILGFAKGWLRGGRLFWICEAALFLLVSAHRAETGQICLAFIILALVYLCIKRYRCGDPAKAAASALVKAAVIFAVYAVVLTLTVPQVNTFVTLASDGEEFAEFDTARINYIDYPHDKYVENPELFESIGWDYNLSVLMGNWFFMDSRVTADNLQYLVDNSTVETADTMAETLEDAWDSDSIRYSYLIWLTAAVLVLIALIVRDMRGNIGEISAQLLNICGTHFLLIYLIYAGRMPYRTVAAVLIPGMVFTILMFCNGKDWDGGWEVPQKMGYAASAVWLPSLCLALVMLTCVALDRETVQDRRYDMAVYGVVCEYTEEHTENIYIRIPGMFSNLNAAFKMTYLSGNMIGWGGSQWGSSSNRSLWEKNGITEPTAEVFMNENTYLLFDRDITQSTDGCDIIITFYDYLWDLYDVQGFVTEEAAGGIYAYRFIFDEEYQGEYYYLTEDGYCLLYGAGDEVSGK